MGGVRIAGPLLAMAALAACQSTVWRADFARAPERIHTEDPFVKCHTPDGHLYLLERWSVDVPGRVIRGEGRLFDAERSLLGRGHFDVSFDEVALVETNRPETIVNTGVPLLGIVSVASLGVTTYCATTPKACFGSCPTFWASAGARETLQAEGFSSSVARAYEATDVDALWDAVPTGDTFDVRMTNEALETHVVRSVRVLATPRPDGARVARAGERYVEVRDPSPPSDCRLDDGASCIETLATLDGREYLSTTDGRDLRARETVELSFPARPGAVALLVHGRASLLDTFLFYQVLAWAGLDAGEWLAGFDRSAAAGDRSSLPDLSDVLGGVDVSALGTDGVWRAAADGFGEEGPIAPQTQAVLLPDGVPSAGELRVRLRMTRGHVKLDRVVLVSVAGEVAAVEVPLVSVLRRGEPDERARALLAVGGEALVTYPGDAYVLRFRLPDRQAHELFLEARGYYYEWMRSEWLGEQSAAELVRLVADPSETLRRLAPRYRSVEPVMERVFWQSRYGR